MNSVSFADAFEALTGKLPFPWQEALYEEFAAGKFRPSATLPTGLGKTSVIAVWLIALANHPDRVPRRLVYVVNRRTVVDQSTTFAMRLRKTLMDDARLQSVKDRLSELAATNAKSPLAISTLRGQFADNGEWSKDPSRPAVVVGTIDLIGSRLLFSGYRAGFKTRPLFAGFLGQDALLVHDEAHLEPAFQRLLDAIRGEQCDNKDFRPLDVMALTATARGDGGETPFGLTDKDLANATVNERLNAPKRLAFHPVGDEKEVVPRIVELALAHKDSGKKILVFVRSVDAVYTVRKGLTAGRDKVPAESVSILIGPMRGYEREQLAEEDGVFIRFLSEPAEGEARTAEPVEGTVYLICTAAGEVGVDMSADHLVCDLTPYDSMAQRFGRVNRYGKVESQIDVVHEAKPSEKKKGDAFDKKRWLTLELLGRLNGNASPAALRDLPREQAQEAFTPTPRIPPAGDILFDAWALTTIRDWLPGRPPVADWLHGIAEEWQPPETVVAWRQEVWELRPQYNSDEERKALEAAERKRLAKSAEDLLEDYPLKPHELLRDRTERVFKHLESLADDRDPRPVWVIEPDESVSVTTLGELVAGGKDRLNDCTVLLSEAIGGLTKAGTLGTGGDTKLDVADEWATDGEQTKRRCRLWNDAKVPPEWGPMRLVRTIVLDGLIDTASDADDEPTPKRIWKWYVRPRSADDDGSKSATKQQPLPAHLELAGRFARAIATKLKLPANIVEAVTIAAQRHDTGKDRKVWQQSIGNTDYPNLILAKSGGTMRPIELNHYRHEFGSLMEADADIELRGPAERDLILHLIAAHHGRGRPHFPADEAFDPKFRDEECIRVAREIPKRFARLQRRFGRWWLAYLESLIRAADYLASEGTANE